MCTCTPLPQVDLDGYYETLNFDMEKIKEGESPSIKEIQKAYRKACLKCHPDKFPHDKFPEKAEMFDKVQEAFEAAYPREAIERFKQRWRKDNTFQWVIHTKAHEETRGS